MSERHQVTATIGPFYGYVVSLTPEQADQAVLDKWGIRRSEPPYDMAIPPSEFPSLTEAERVHAEQAARAWWSEQPGFGK